MSTSLDSSTTHDDNTDVYKKRYEEGYDIYDESYVRWLMEHHPGDVKSEWLTKTTTTSKSFEPDQPSEESQVVFIYGSVFGALHNDVQV